MEKDRRGEGKPLDITEWAFEEEEKLRKEWDNKVESGKLPVLHGINWRLVNRKAEIDVETNPSILESFAF